MAEGSKPTKNMIIVGALVVLTAGVTMVKMLDDEEIIDVGPAIDRIVPGGSTTPADQIETAVLTRLQRDRIYRSEEIETLINLCAISPCPNGQGPGRGLLNELRLTLIRNGWSERNQSWEHDGF